MTASHLSLDASRLEDTVLAARYASRHYLRDGELAGGKPTSSLARLRHCGKTSTGTTVALEQRPDGRIVANGLQHCMSVWACPVCSAKAMAVRAREIGEVIDAWRKLGGHVAILTATIGHSADDRLGESIQADGTVRPGLWDDLQDIWSYVVGSSPWQTMQKEFGHMMPGRSAGTRWQSGPLEKGPQAEVDALERLRPRIPMIRTVEATVGQATGWHPHVHALMFLSPDLTRGQAESALVDMMNGYQPEKLEHHQRKPRRVRGWRELWGARAAKLGRKFVDEGIEAHIVSDDGAALAGEYLAKQVLSGTIELEIAGGQFKHGRKNRYSPFQLVEILSKGLMPELQGTMQAWWREWEQVSRGRRQIVMSAGLRHFLGLDDEVEEDALIDAAGTDAEAWTPAMSDKQQYAPVQGPSMLVGMVSGKFWREQVCPSNAELMFSVWAMHGRGRIAEAIENMGAEVVRTESGVLDDIVSALGHDPGRAVVVL